MARPLHRYVQELSEEGGSGDEEEEAEDDEDDYDRAFIDDEEGEEQGPPVAAFEATIEIEQEKECKACNGRHCKHTCAKGNKRKKPDGGKEGGGKSHVAGEADDGDDMKKNKGVLLPSAPRELIPIPQKGLGLGNVCDRIEALSLLTRPYFLQPLIGANGPWDHRPTKDWFLDRREQLRFAQIFSRPLLDEGLRAVGGACDDEGDGVPLGSYSSKVMFTFRNTHEPTELDMQFGELTDVCLPQYATDRQSSLLLSGGPEGGLMGVHSAVLWKMSAESPSVATDADILLLAACLMQASHGSDMPGAMWYSPNTHFTDMKACATRNKCHSSVRYFTTQDLNALQDTSCIRVSDDLCPYTLALVVSERARRGDFNMNTDEEGGGPDTQYGLDDEHIVPRCRATNNLDDMGRDLSEAEDRPHEQMQERLFDVFVHTDVVQGVDSFGNAKKIRIDCLLIKMKVPGGDVGQLLNCMRNIMPGVVLPLTNVLSHMALTMKLHVNGVNLNEVFNPGARHNISLLTAEAQMLPAIFELAGRHDMHHVRWRGISYDCSSAEAVAIYRRMLAGVLHSRAQHYRVVCMGCNRDTRPSFKYQDQPMDNYGKTLELYGGIHYVRFSKNWLHTQFVEMKSRYSAEQMTPSLQRQLHQDYMEYQDMLVGDERNWYLAVDGPVSWNSGIVGLANSDILARYDKQPGRPFVVEPMLHMHIQCKMFNIWLRSNLESDSDPYVEFFEGDNEKRPVADLRWMQQHDGQLSALVMDLRKSINCVLQDGAINNKDRRRLKQEVLMRAYGQSTHPVHEQLVNTTDSACIEGVANMVFTTFAYNLRSTVSSGELSELRNVKFPMLSMQEYKTYGVVSGDKWKEDYVGFFSELDQQKGSPREHLHEGVLAARWMDRCRERLKLDLSWCNWMLFDSIQDSLIAAFCWQPHQWGAALKVADMAHHAVVLKKTAKNTREEFTVDWKSPSAGIDSTIDKLGAVNGAFAEYFSLGNELSRFTAGRDGLDHTAAHVTPLSMATWLGSGLALNSDGTVDMTATTFRDDAFLGGYITEHKKDQASSSASEDKAGTLERFMGHSGRGSGTQERPWSTTRNQDSRSYMQLYNMPLIILCGNRPDGCFPASSLMGGRYGVLASSVLCGNNGVFMVVVGQKHVPVQTAPPANVPPKRKLAREGNHKSDDKAPIKGISRDIVMSNMAYFSWRHVCRRIFPPVHRNMTLNYCEPGYVLRTDFRSMNRIWRLLTEDLRRQYLKDAETASRTWFGVYVTSTAFPVWVKSVVAMCHMRAVELSQPSGERMITPIYRAIEDSFTCMKFTPMSFHAQLEALYVFTTQKSLDINTMILSCFAMHTMGLQNNCELHVIALACQGLSLTDEQQQSYDVFCEFLLDKVTAESPRKGLVHAGYFKEQSMEQLFMSCEFQDAAYTDNIKQLWQLRSQPVLVNSASVFLRPEMDVVAFQVPEAIKHMMDVKKNTPGTSKLVPDPFICASAEDMVAELWARQNTEEAEKMRVLKQGPQEAHHHPAAWWNTAAVPGTRLPGKMRLVTSDKYNIQFEPCFETGHYFRETIKNMASAQGVVRHLLMMFGLAEDATREEFLDAVLKPYMQRKGIGPRKVLNNPMWRKKIVDGDVPCFKFGSMPYMKTALDRATGVETVLGMDVLWLVVAQGLYCREWHSGMRNDYKTVVHQRNMGGQAAALMSLMLHTQIDKSIVPACTKDNYVVLSLPSGVLNANMQSEGCARVFFDARLSTDSFMLDGTRDNNNMLNVRMRSEADLVLLPVQGAVPHHPSSTLYYKSIMEAGESAVTLGNIGSLCMFPPESTYHMQTHLMFCQSAYRCFYRIYKEKIRDGQSRFATALRLWASSVQHHSTTFIPNLLTNCAVSCVKEIPCMTYEGGYLFTLRVHPTTGTVLIVPTQPTHEAGDQFERDMHPPWKALPIEGIRTFKMRHLGVVMCAGLEKSTENPDDVLLVMPADRPLKSKRNMLPFMYVPFINWNTAMDVQIAGEQLSTPDGMLRIVNLEKRFLETTPYFVDTAAWRLENPSMPAVAQGSTLYVVDMPAGRFFWIKRVLCDASGIYQFFYFNSKEHLQHTLRANDGSPCAFEINNRTQWREMIAGALLIDDHTYESNAMFPICADDEGETYYRTTSFDGTLVAVAEVAVHTAQFRLKAVLDRNKDIMARLDTCRTNSSKSFLMWDSAYAAVFEEKKVNDNLLTVRTEELRLASDAAALTEIGVVYKHCAIGASAKRTLLAVPFSETVHGERTIGVLKANPVSGSFMHMGKYYVEFLSTCGRCGSFSVDFMRASECMFREGQALYLHMDCELYADFQGLLPNLRVADSGLHSALLLPEGLCRLEVYYVLGDSKKIQLKDFGHRSCVRVAINTGDSGIVIVFVSLFREREGSDGVKCFTPNLTVKDSAMSSLSPVVSQLEIIDRNKPHSVASARGHAGACCWK